jgi:2-dehydro-3-deoxygluconokinase
MTVPLRAAGECELDILSLGESMVRLSPPGHERIEMAPLLRVWVGGGEYNVAYNAARLGLRAGWASALPDNPMGRIILNHARAAGMDVRHVLSVPYDGLGRDSRVGLAWIEVGIGPRPSVTVYDRGHSAASQLKPGDIDWDTIFRKRGVRWLHTGGVFTSLSAGTRQLVLEAVQAADAAGTFVSYDLNYRASLWSIDQAIAATRPLLPHIHCFIGNIGQFQIVLGRPVEGFDLATDRVEADAFERHVKVIATTLREVRTSQINDFSGLMWLDGRTYQGMRFNGLEIEDRVGGGDAFAAGLAYGLLTGADPDRTVNLATAYGALAHTTPGDTSQITLHELERAAQGGGARIVR